MSAASSGLGSIANSLVSAVTGVDPTTLSGELTGAEQQLVLVVEVGLLLLALNVIGTFFIVMELRNR